MGLCGSYTMTVDPKYAPEHKEDLSKLNRLLGVICMPVSDMNKVAKAFDKARSRARRGTCPPRFIDVETLSAFVGYKMTPFGEKAFDTVQDWRDGYGELLLNPHPDDDTWTVPSRTRMLEFSRFLVFLWNLCTLEKKGLAYMVWNLYDELGEDSMDKHMIDTIVQDVYGGDDGDSRLQMGRAAAAYQKHHVWIKLQGATTMCKAEFAAIATEVKSMLEPIDNMRFRYAHKFGGASLWSRMIAKRREKVGRQTQEQFDRDMRRIGLSLYSTVTREDIRERGGMNADDVYFHNARKKVTEDDIADHRRAVREERREIAAATKVDRTDSVKQFFEARRRSRAGSTGTASAADSDAESGAKGRRGSAPADLAEGGAGGPAAKKKGKKKKKKADGARRRSAGDPAPKGSAPVKPKSTQVAPA